MDDSSLAMPSPRYQHKDLPGSYSACTLSEAGTAGEAGRSGAGREEESRGAGEEDLFPSPHLPLLPTEVPFLTSDSIVGYVASSVGSCFTKPE